MKGSFMLLTDDIRPIYLGYEDKTHKYYFYFIKDKAPRFLVYAAYFFWGIGPQTALSLVPIPEQVELDLHEFLEGRLSYEFRKKRTNSRDNSVFKVYRSPQESSSSSPDASAETASIKIVLECRETVAGNRTAESKGSINERRDGLHVRS